MIIKPSVYKHCLIVCWNIPFSRGKNNKNLLEDKK